MTKTENNILLFSITLCWSASYLFIKSLPPSNASFLAALTILVVPLLLLFIRRKPSRNNIAGAFVIVAGLCLGSQFSLSAFLNRGTLYMLLGCLCSPACRGAGLRVGGGAGLRIRQPCRRPVRDV